MEHAAEGIRLRLLIGRAGNPKLFTVTVLTSTTFIIGLIVVIFAVDSIARWWRENEWKRRWRKRHDDD